MAIAVTGLLAGQSGASSHAGQLGLSRGRLGQSGQLGQSSWSPHGSPRPKRPGRRGLGVVEAGGHEEVGRMWRQLQVVLKPRQGCRGKRYQELHLLGPLGAAQGPGGSGPDVVGGQEAA